MSTGPKPMTIEERPYQRFCFNRDESPETGLPLTDIQVIIHRLYKKGFSASAIAKELGINRYIVTNNAANIQHKGWSLKADK